jgi:hypothetical protein
MSERSRSGFVGFTYERPKLDMSPVNDALDTLYDRRKKRDEEDRARRIGSALESGDMGSAQGEAFRSGDLRTGLELRKLSQADSDRTRRISIEDEDRRFKLQDRQRADADREEARKEKARGYISNVLTTLDPESPTFSADWKGHLDRMRRSGHNVGAEYDDPVSGHRLALAHVTGYKDRESISQRNRQLDQRDEELGIRRGDADTRRAATMVKIAEKWSGRTPTEAEWTQESQPGGLIYAQFGGQAVPYSEAPRVMAQAAQARQRSGVPSPEELRDAGVDETDIGDLRRRATVRKLLGQKGADEYERSRSSRTEVSNGDPVNFEPSEREKALGVTREMKMKEAEQQRLLQAYGRKVKTGNELYRAEDGSIRERPAAAPLKAKNEQLGAALELGSRHLDDAEKKLLSYSMPARAIYGKLGVGEVGEALIDYTQGVRSTLGFISGQTVTNQEVQSYFGMYFPEVGDSVQRIQFKTTRLKGIMTSIAKGVEAGLSYEKARTTALTEDRRNGQPPRAKQENQARPTPQSGARDAGDGFSWRPKGEAN